MNGARGNVAGHKVTVFGVPLLEEVEALGLGNLFDGALVAGHARYPNAPALTTRRLRHQPQFIFAGDAGGMDLNAFAVRVSYSLLVNRRLRRAGADHGVSALAEDSSNAAGCQNDSVGGEAAQFHRAQVECGDAARDAFRIDNCGEKLPALVLLYFAFGLIPPHLLVERVE